MHVDLDAFFVSVEQVENPELRGKPVVVGGRPGGRGVVASASYEARAFGVRSAMPLSQASRLCPQAIFIEGSYQKYRKASHGFMQVLEQFSPFLEPMGLDEAYLDVTGFESLHGSIVEMARSIKRQVQEQLSLCASVGIASCKVVAKVASDLSKPDGLVEVPAGTERSFLAPLPVGNLPGVGRKVEEVLMGWGLRTIGQLAALPPDTLKYRFGSYGEVLHRFANGIDDRKVELPGTARSISRETTLEQDSTDRLFLKATLRYQSEKVGADLRRHGRRARCVTMKLRYGDFTTITRSHTLLQSTDSDSTIFETGEKMLDRALATEKRPVRLIGIGVTNLVDSGRQLDMLDNSSERQELLDRAVDRIRSKYGFSAIQTGRTLPLREMFRKRR